jgi:hypothetical protein
LSVLCYSSKAAPEGYNNSQQTVELLKNSSSTLMSEYEGTNLNHSNTQGWTNEFDCFWF